MLSSQLFYYLGTARSFVAENAADVPRFAECFYNLFGKAAKIDRIRRPDDKTRYLVMPGRSVFAFRPFDKPAVTRERLPYRRCKIKPVNVVKAERMKTRSFYVRIYRFIRVASLVAERRRVRLAAYSQTVKNYKITGFHIFIIAFPAKGFNVLSEIHAFLSAFPTTIVVLRAEPGDIIRSCKTKPPFLHICFPSASNRRARGTAIFRTL